MEKNTHPNKLSIVVPCYNEENSILIFYKKVLDTISNIKKNLDNSLQYEFIFVDDGSIDNTSIAIKNLNEKDKSVRLIKFSRNFGKEAAILAGFHNANGNAVILMDADLQDPPYLIEKMYRAWFYNEAEIIYAKRTNRKGETFFKAQLSELFYTIANIISEMTIESGVRDFRLMDRSVINELIKMNEYHRFSKMIFTWVGFRKICLEYEYTDRANGKSSWNFISLFHYAIEGIVSFSTKPLKIAFWIGLFISLISGLYGLYIIFGTLIYGNEVKGYPSLVTIVLFLGGIQLVFLGIFGQYIARIYEEVKKRPHYIIMEQDEKDVTSHIKG